MSNPNNNTDLSPRQLAHELANLLDGSLRNVSLVQSALRDGDAATRAATRPDGDTVRRLESAEKGLRHMAALIKRWLADCRDAPALHRGNGTVAEVIDHAVRLQRPAADALHVDVVIDIAPALRPLAGGAIFPVVTNALRNSLDAFGALGIEPRDHRQVTIRVAECDGWFELTVKDNGPGVPPHVMGLDGFPIGSTTKQDGHGLGLALCRDIAEGLGGSVRLTKAPTGGAVLTFRSPMPAAAPQPQRQSGAA